MTSRAKGKGVHNIVTMRDEGGEGGVKSRVTSHLRQSLAWESWMIALVFRRSFLYQNFDILCLLLQMCRIIQKTALCLKLI